MEEDPDKKFQIALEKFAKKEISEEEFEKAYMSLPMKVYDFDKLVEKFLNKQISTKEFETIFWDVWPEQGRISPDYWRHLNELFYSMEAFRDVSLENAEQRRDDEIDEDQLRVAAKIFLENIRALK